MIIISNTTRQKHRFNFRLPGKSQYTYIDIPSGQQKEFGKGFGAGELESLIEQLDSAGARPKEEIHKKADLRFSGLVYSLAKPLKEEEIQSSAEKVIEAKEIISAQESIKSAIGSDAAINEISSGGRRKSRTTGVEVIATDENGREIKGGINMNLTVDPEGEKMKLPGN